MLVGPRLLAITKWRPPSNLPLLGLIAVIGALGWSLLGCLIAAIGGSARLFWREWILIQGFFAVAAAIFLGLMAISPALVETLHQAANSCSIDEWMQRPATLRWRWFVMTFVALVGTATTTSLGFVVPPPARYFMWATCLVVCIFAGFITWHAAEVIYTAANMDTLQIKFFVYSPGETRSLKKLAIYFVTFSLGVTFGYIFALLGTMSPLWRGGTAWVNSVRAFWPIIYVPLCLALTTYPHLAIHSLIRREKDRLIISYQEEINTLISDGRSPSKENIERINALADLIKKIEDSPSFALSFPIALGTAFTYLINIGSLFISKEHLTQIIRSFLVAH